MTAAVYRSTPSLSIPQSQNTAPVLEFNCLYTHDVRRKQKRWQDGFLRYHTFNKRVMVYDVPRNFVGDTHWTRAGDLAEGDEITLEKNGVMVEVAEAVGRTETDLSEVVQQKAKPSPSKGSSSPAFKTPARSGTAAVQLKHKSLNSLLSSSRGELGKAALPTKSPFELRHGGQENEEWESGRSAKRQKIQDWNVTRTTKVTTPRREDPLWARTADAKKRALNSVTKPSSAGRKSLGVREVVDLSSDADEPVTKTRKHLPALATPDRANTRQNRDNSETRGSSPGPAQETPAPVRTRRAAAPPMDNTKATEQLQIFAAPKPTASKLKAPNRITGHARDSTLRKRALERRSSPPVSTTNRLRPPSEPEPAPPSAVNASDAIETGSQSTRRGAPLKLTSTAPRKMLICESQLSRPSSHEKRMPDARRKVSVKESDAAEPEAATLTAHQRRLQERLAQIGKKKRTLERSSSDGSALNVDDSGEPLHARGQACSSRTPPPPEDMTLEHGRMDRCLLTATVAAAHDAPAMAPLREAPRAPSRVNSEPDNTPQVQPRAVSRAEIVPAPKPFKRTKGLQKEPTRLDLTSASNPETSTLIAKPFKPPSKPATEADKPKDTDLGPWSKEAFDLMDWRPPGWLEAATEREGGEEVGVGRKRGLVGLSGGVDGRG